VIDYGPLPAMLGYALRRAQLAVFQDFHRSLADLDVSPADYSVLTVVQRNPGLRQFEVADALAIKRTNFVVLFTGLCERGLARRERVPDDLRSSALHLTPAGEALVSELHARVAAHDAAFVARIGDAQRDTLLDLLGRLSGTHADA
jgi:DNA-binding MarR family transcriptional regulator